MDESDIFINPSEKWITRDIIDNCKESWDAYSLEMVLTHEVGHAVGLPDNGVQLSIMSIERGTCKGGLAKLVNHKHLSIRISSELFG